MWKRAQGIQALPRWALIGNPDNAATHNDPHAFLQHTGLDSRECFGGFWIEWGSCKLISQGAGLSLLCWASAGVALIKGLDNNLWRQRHLCFLPPSLRIWSGLIISNLEFVDQKFNWTRFVTRRWSLLFAFAFAHLGAAAVISNHVISQRWLPFTAEPDLWHTVTLVSAFNLIVLKII